MQAELPVSYPPPRLLDAASGNHLGAPAAARSGAPRGQNDGDLLGRTSSLSALPESDHTTSRDNREFHTIAHAISAAGLGWGLPFRAHTARELEARHQCLAALRAGDRRAALLIRLSYVPREQVNPKALDFQTARASGGRHVHSALSDYATEATSVDGQTHFLLQRTAAGARAATPEDASPPHTIEVVLPEVDAPGSIECTVRRIPIVVPPRSALITAAAAQTPRPLFRSRSGTTIAEPAPTERPGAQTTFEVNLGARVRDDDVAALLDACLSHARRASERDSAAVVIVAESRAFAVARRNQVTCPPIAHEIRYKTPAGETHTHYSRTLNAAEHERVRDDRLTLRSLAERGLLHTMAVPPSVLTDHEKAWAPTRPETRQRRLERRRFAARAVYTGLEPLIVRTDVQTLPAVVTIRSIAKLRHEL